MRENRDKLAGKYFEPARLTVSAREKKFAQLAEGPISIANFRVSCFDILVSVVADLELTFSYLLKQTFVFEKQQDYDYLMTNLADKDINIDGKTTRLRISSWQYSQGATMADFPNKFSDEQVSRISLITVFKVMDMAKGIPLSFSPYSFTNGDSTVMQSI